MSVHSDLGLPGLDHEPSVHRPPPVLVFPVHDAPTVSVVIPVHDRLEITRRCLAALLSAHNDATYEVIIVDDASTDETRRLSEVVRGITLLRSETNRGFVRSCNAGAGLAKGDYITFLNNDTEPTNRWLDEMLLVFRNFENVGLVGSKLLYPDGRLQEAGGIVWSNGDVWNYGRGQDPSLPQFGFTRQADYLSGASITLDRDTWQRVDGFSEEFAPAYFEDTDLAFKVRAMGRKSVFAPLSVVIHDEGASGGTDIGSGVKRYQEMNRPLFKAKWASALAAQPRLGGDPCLAAEHRAGTRRVLFVDSGLPLPGCLGRGYETVQEMRLFQSLGYKVTCVTEDEALAGEGSEPLQRMGVEVAGVPRAVDLASLLKARGPEFDVVYLADPVMATQVVRQVRRWAPRAKLVIVLRGPDRLNASGRDRDRARPSLAKLTRDRPWRAIREADVVLADPGGGSPAMLTDSPTADHMALAPHVVDVEESILPAAMREGVAFLGDAGYLPDRQALEFLELEVMPRVRERRSDITLHVYGGDWHQTDLRYPAAPGVSFASAAIDAVRAYARHRVAVVPVVTGPGRMARTVAAFACGIPQVFSTAAFELSGLHDVSGACVAEQPAEWAQWIVMLCEADGVWQSRSDASRQHARQAYSFERGRSLMRAALEMAGEPAVSVTDVLVVRVACPHWSISS